MEQGCHAWLSIRGAHRFGRELEKLEMDNSWMEPTGAAVTEGNGHNRQDTVSMLDTSDLWRSCNRSAASPLGSRLRPVSRSLTDEGASPTCEPISARVIPFLRRSEMRIDQGDIVRKPTAPRNSCQRLSVTEFRHNTVMGRPASLPKFDIIGKRVKWWREYREISRKDFAKKIPMPSSTLSDLELGRSE